MNQALTRTNIPILSQGKFVNNKIPDKAKSKQFVLDVANKLTETDQKAKFINLLKEVSIGTRQASPGCITEEYVTAQLNSILGQGTGNQENVDIDKLVVIF